MASVMQPPIPTTSAASAAAIAFLSGTPSQSTNRQPLTTTTTAKPKPAVRPPRRSQSLSECDNAPTRNPYVPTLPTTLASPTSPAFPGLESVTEVSHPGTPVGDVAFNGPFGAPAGPPPVGSGTAVIAGRMARPKPKKPPRRAFSLMDSEPIVHIHKPSDKWSLLDLPTDILFNIFDFLDPIDSVCFGLASRHTYPIHRRLYGWVSLAARRNGPNTLEWAWRNGGNLRYPGLTPPQSPVPKVLPQPMKIGTPVNSTPTTPAESHSQFTNFPNTASAQNTPTATTGKAATAGPNGTTPRINRDAILRDGQVYCRKCGTSRCELHSHLREWMGSNLEYCSVTQKFGRRAAPGSRDSCYRRSPKNPNVCGRHAPKVRASAPVSPRLEAVA